MDIFSYQSYQKVKTIALKLDSTSVNTVVIYENTGEQNDIPNTNLVSVNGFVKNLKAFSRITSLDPIQMPEITDDDSDTQKLYKLLDVEWTSPRKQLDFLISDGGDWSVVGSISLLNPSGYPYRTYSIQDLYTDNLAIEVGVNGKLGVRVIDAGYGLLSGTDTVTVYGSYVEELCVTSLASISSTIPFGTPVTNISSVIVEANNSRKYLAITNNSEVDIYLNLGDTAFINQGIYLAASGGSYELATNQIPYFGAISAIAASNTTISGLESV